LEIVLNIKLHVLQMSCRHCNSATLEVSMMSFQCWKCYLHFATLLLFYYINATFTMFLIWLI